MTLQRLLSDYPIPEEWPPFPPTNPDECMKCGDGDVKAIYVEESVCGGQIIPEHLAWTCAECECEYLTRCKDFFDDKEIMEIAARAIHDTLPYNLDQEACEKIAETVIKAIG